MLSFILRYGVMVALRILVPSVRVRIPISQQTIRSVFILVISVISVVVTHGRNIMGNYFYFI